MIVSIDTIMCGKQIVLFFGQESVVVVETSKILLLLLLFFFNKKGLLLLKKHFETGMLMLPKIIYLLCHFTVHPVNIHIIRPKDRNTHARCKSGMSGQRGSREKA